MANTPARFSVKSVNLYVKAQTAIGTAATLAATNVVACTDLTYGTNITTDEDKFSGSVTERDSLTTVKDRTVDIKATVLFPKLGVISGTPGVSDVSFATLFNICNAVVNLSGTGNTSKATITNATATSTVATVGFVRTSSDLATDGTFKRYLSTDCLATADLSIEAGGKAKITFNIVGNFAVPTMQTALVPDYALQKANYAYNIKKATINLAELYAWTPTAVPTGTTNLCFYKLSSTNIFGQELTRNLSGCAEEYDRQATQGDLTITVREDAADVGIEWFSQIEKFFGFRFAWANAAPTVTEVGSLSKIKFTKLQLVDVKPSSNGNRATLDLVFKIVGDSILEMDSSLTAFT